jgi:hypothetical protein
VHSAAAEEFPEPFSVDAVLPHSTFLSKATTVLAVAFMVNCILLTFSGGGTGVPSSRITGEAQRAMEDAQVTPMQLPTEGGQQAMPAQQPQGQQAQPGQQQGQQQAQPDIQIEPIQPPSSEGGE